MTADVEALTAPEPSSNAFAPHVLAPAVTT